MKSTESFKTAIHNRLIQEAAEDPQMSFNLQNEKKNLDNCITYILNRVKESGCNGFTDDEIYGMAFHYYEEDDIDIGKAIDMKVVVNHQVELTEEEKADVKKKVIEAAIEKEKERLTKKIIVKASVVQDVEQGSLF